MNESSSSSGGGIGFLGLLQIVLITLRLLDVIGWSWWLVMLPTLIPIAFVAGYLLLVVVPLAFIGGKQKSKSDSKRKGGGR